LVEETWDHYQYFASEPDYILSAANGRLKLPVKQTMSPLGHKGYFAPMIALSDRNTFDQSEILSLVRDVSFDDPVDQFFRAS
jgi:hypothetical protein